MKKKIPVISQLLRAIIVDDYETAEKIVNSEDFNPNETNDSWCAPVATAIVNVISTSDKYAEKQGLKSVLKNIINNDKFNPNITDAEGETLLMHVVRYEAFNWLIPFIINKGNVDITIKNFMHHDAIEIAENVGNTTAADILLPLKAEHSYKGLPRKREGIKKVVKTTINISPKRNENIIQRIENSFDEEYKKGPVSLYNLLLSFFKGDYTTCIEIVKDVNFEPNECDKWGEPALSSLIYFSQDSDVEYNEEMYKKIADIIISNRKFDVNAIDSDCNTILMVSMGFPKLNWLTEKLFNIQSARLDIINDRGEAIREIADLVGNKDFYNALVMRSFEEVDVLN